MKNIMSRWLAILALFRVYENFSVNKDLEGLL